MHEVIVRIKEWMSLSNKLQFASCSFEKHHLQKQPGEEWVYFNYRFQFIIKRSWAKLKEERNLETDTEAETVEEQYWLAYSVTILIQARLISPVMTLPTTGWSALNQFAIRKKNPSHVCRGQSDEDDSLSASLFPDVSTWQPRLYIHHNTHFTLLSFNSLL